jgi:hypothetical protein
VLLAFWWASAVVASEAGNGSAGAKAAKRETARFFFARILPRCDAHSAAFNAGADSLMNLAAEHFD